MMLRVLAFALFADEGLAFGKGLSTADEPDLFQGALDGRTLLWVRLGCPDARELRQACGRAEKVVVLSYGGRPVDVWWQGVRADAERLARLEVLEVPAEASAALATLARRSFALQVTIQDGLIWLCVDDAPPVQLELVLRKAAGGG